jgi:hypothetical protein
MDKGLKPHSAGSQTGAGQNKKGQSQQGDSEGPDLIDAVNQMFAEFELAYHNQFQKAYGDPDRLVLAKKYWLQCLGDFHPQQILVAARHLVKTQTYLPTVSSVVNACEQGMELFGLPTEYEAYVEACRAPAPKSSYNWSHAAVYQAGQQTDWFVLATEPEEKVLPRFAYFYRQLCKRVLHGEDLSMPVAHGLPERSTRVPEPGEQEAHMQALRKKLSI